MLNFKNVALRRGVRQLFAHASFTLHKGQKVGFTGANGTGKSSLFALIRGEIPTDEGEFSMPPGLELAHVSQETPASDTFAIDYVMDGDRELRQLQQELELAERGSDGLKQAELHAAFDHIGGYTAKAKAARLMNGLGFTPEQENNPVRSFSGGWRMRLNLAQALMCRSDVLMLDEPTNHLDLDAVIWLQDWLCQYDGTLLLISHDRDFLDAITGHIVHIEQQRVELYTGNYSAFETMRVEKLAQQQAAFAKQQREIAHIKSFVDRFKAKATKARQAQSRIKALERMELIAAAHVDSPFDFSFPPPGRMPNPLLKLEEVVAGYGNNPVVQGVNLSIAPGDRIGLLGPNGAGKSTLIKVLAGDLAALSGVRLGAEALRLGYFAQHQLEQLRLDESPLWHLQKQDPKATEKELRNFLGGFDFQGDKVSEPVRPFSGGEKARLVLALLVYTNPNLLLLDEPTNHLDLEMRQALSVALQDYQGALVLISHDRHLLRTVVDRFLLVGEGKALPFDGDLDDYRLWLSGQKKAEQKSEGLESSAAISRKDQRKLEAERRQKHKPLADALKRAEALLEKYHAEQAAVDLELADQNLYGELQKERLRTVLARKADIDKALQSAEEAWLLAEENLAAAQVEG
jgi:ATP-binding cassette, subfamily F, member 3